VEGTPGVGGGRGREALVERERESLAHEAGTRRVFPDDAAQEVRDVRAGEGHAPGHGLEHDDAETEHVGARIDVRVARGLLRGRVARGPEDASDLALSLVAGSARARAHPEVEEAHAERTVGGAVHEDVLGLHVAVHVAVLVRGVQDGGDAHGDRADDLGREHADAAQDALQALAVDALHHEVGRAVGSREAGEDALVEDRDDRRVRHGARHLGLAAQAAHEIGVVHERRTQDLHDHVLAVREARGLECDGRSADAEHVSDAVASVEDSPTDFGPFVRDVLLHRGPWVGDDATLGEAAGGVKKTDEERESAGTLDVMKLLLMRHGEAVRHEGMDEARHLSRTGRHETLAVARALAPRVLGLAGGRISFVVSSHLVRAVQTAEIVVNELTRARVEINPMVHAAPYFGPDGPPRHAAQRLEKLAHEHAPGIVLCACHEPIVRGIAAHLTRQASYGHFATSGLVYIEDGHALWSLDPKSAG